MVSCPARAPYMDAKNSQSYNNTSTDSTRGTNRQLIQGPKYVNYATVCGGDEVRGHEREWCTVDPSIIRQVQLTAVHTMAVGTRNCDQW
jgi:hypothetical protein